MMMRAVLVFAFSCVIFSANAQVNFEECGSTIAVQKVTIDNCVGTTCQVVRGVSTNFTVTLRTGTNNYSEVKSKVSLNYIGLNSELQTTPNDPCESLHCPLQANHQGSYTASFAVSQNFTWLPVVYKLKFLLLTFEEEQIVCVTVPIELF